MLIQRMFRGVYLLVVPIILCDWIMFSRFKIGDYKIGNFVYYKQRVALCDAEKP